MLFLLCQMSATSARKVAVWFLYSLGWVVVVNVGEIVVEDHHYGDVVPQETLRSCTVSSINRNRSETSREPAPRRTDRTILSQRWISDVSCTAGADVPAGKYHSRRSQSSKRCTVSLWQLVSIIVSEVCLLCPASSSSILRSFSSVGLPWPGVTLEK